MDNEQAITAIHDLLTSMRMHEVTREGVESLERIVLSSEGGARLYVQCVLNEQSLHWWARSGSKC